MLGDAVRGVGSGAGTDGAVTAEVVGRLPHHLLQALDPSLVIDAPGPVLAAASFLLTVLFGGTVIYRDGGRVDSAIAASKTNPLVSVVYGLMAFAIVVFLVGYGLSQLSNLGLGATGLTVVGGLVIGVVLLSLGGLGFVVVGARLTELFGARDPWLGLIGVGTVSAVAWLVLPFGFSLGVWLAIAAVGIGGPTRQWVHQSADPVERA